MRAGSILVVDDDSLVRQTFGEVLAASGYQVTLADSGMAALALLDAAQLDVVLLDIAMPGMNGLDTLARITTCTSRLISMTSRAPSPFR